MTASKAAGRGRYFPVSLLCGMNENKLLSALGRTEPGAEAYAVKKLDLILEGRVMRIRYHYAWNILAAMCLIKGASMCFVTTLNGLFIAPVCEELSVSRVAFTTPQVLMSASSLCTMPLIDKLSSRSGSRTVMSLSAIVYMLCPLILSQAGHISVWYVVSILQGLASGILCTSSIPLVLNNWFRSGYATALGINGAVSSALSMLANPLGAAVMARFGWRMLYVVCGLGLGVMTLPFTFFVLRLHPEELGLKPYGEAACPAGGTAAKVEQRFSRADGAALVVLFTVMTLLMNLVAGAIPMLSDFAATENYPVLFGSKLVSFGLCGAMTAKFVVGPLIQKVGCLRTQLVLTLVSGSGSLLFLCLAGRGLYFSAFACGWFMTTTSVMIPAFMHEVLSPRFFSKWIAAATMASQVTYAAAQAVFAALADASGGYELMFVLSALCCGAAFLIMWKISSLCRHRG